MRKPLKGKKVRAKNQADAQQNAELAGKRRYGIEAE
jgi:hypothetical protein